MSYLQYSYAAAGTPSISAGGIVNGASFAAGTTPTSWITIFGSNLADTTAAAGTGWFSTWVTGAVNKN